MPGVVCPACASRILIDDILIAQGTASCHSCGKEYRLWQLVPVAHAGAARDVFAAAPPNGCRIENDGATLRVIASTRSVGHAVGFLFAALFWNSILGVFVMVATAGIWNALAGSLPAWFPASSGSNQWPLSLAAAIGLSVFLIPFLVIGVMFCGCALVYSLGSIVVTIKGDEGEALTGIGGLGRRRRFQLTPGAEVRLVRTHGGDHPARVIEIGGKRASRFGAFLSDERRDWMARVLRSCVASRSI